MSIAVSAVVRPSRRLRALVAAYGLANLAAGCAVFLLLPERFAAAQWVALLFLCAAAFLLSACVCKTKTRRIDISGVGTLRLTVQQQMRASEAASEAVGSVATLLAGSTVWPQLMLLHLRLPNGARTRLALMPDSVAPGAFRALAVAVTAISGRNKPLQGKPKIL